MKKRRLKYYNIIPLLLITTYTVHNIINGTNIIVNMIPILLIGIASKIVLKDLIKNKKEHKKNIIELLNK